MINRLKLKFGATPGAPHLDVLVTPITVFVGPNNAGKSKALLEIENLVRPGGSMANTVIIEDVSLASWSQSKIEQEISKHESPSEPNERVAHGSVIIEKMLPLTNEAARVHFPRDHLIIQAQNNQHHDRHWYRQFLSLFMIRLDGTSRLNLTNTLPAGDLQKKARNHIARLFADNKLRAELRHIVFDALAKYLVIDPTNIGQLRLRLSDRAPMDEREEKGWEAASVKFHSEAFDIQYASDGVKAFVGVMSILLAGDPKITLLDEPEAFLHPALASRLGKEIGRSVAGSDKRVFVSTHSSAFLIGCIQSGVPLNIIRLTYNYLAPTARLLPQDKLLHLMRHPLLRSTGVLGALFFESAIVTESDSDRAFYQEINERLLAANDPRAIPNCLFLNAQNKQTVWEIVRPLRELGIPAAGIVDIDVLKEGGQVWSKLLEGVFIPSLNHSALQNQRQSLMQAFTQTGKNMKRDGGNTLLAPSDREASDNLFALLGSYGVFVVPGGELESWLKHLGATGHGPSWLIQMFEKLGENPDTMSYIKPNASDVWGFMEQLRNWIMDPLRKGIPS